MAADDDDALIPEPDRAPNAPHPREVAALYGQRAAEAEFLTALTGGRMHHGWLLTGPRGVGKATLAWRIARHLIAHGAPQDSMDALFAPAPVESLAMDPEAPVFRRCAALSEPRLKLIRRTPDPKTKRMRTQIVVDDVRTLRDFTGLSAADGGWRAVIVDPAEEMNPAAANAILKMLEEPPARCIFLLVSHAPARLLPTIRSRCRTLALRPLDEGALVRAASEAAPDLPPPSEALAELAGGSVGEALRLAAADGTDIYAELLQLLRNAPGMDRDAAHRLAESAAGPGTEGAREMLARLGAVFAQRMARAAAMGPPRAEAGPGEARMMARLAATDAQARIWAEAAASWEARLDRALGVNLDPGQAFLDTLLALDAAAGRAASVPERA
ncbi:DNA polymerase III subunit delta' [Rhodovulum sp. DZ06]|uniref:DNA polymerase III subunit delta' n=1 Tax=Rhodovulum sp. DZ06 TaxID=3425126 RepID=UPI003D33D379